MGADPGTCHTGVLGVCGEWLNARGMRESGVMLHEGAFRCGNRILSEVICHNRWFEREIIGGTGGIGI